MNCPWCAFSGSMHLVHVHLVESHPEGMRISERGLETLTYEVSCPLCGATYDRRIKPRVADDAFVAEFEREIRMVAFDMLVKHLFVEHESETIDATEESGG